MKRKRALKPKVDNHLTRHYELMRSRADCVNGMAASSRPGQVDPAIRRAPRAKSLSDMDGNERDGDS